MSLFQSENVDYLGQQSESRQRPGKYPEYLDETHVKQIRNLSILAISILVEQYNRFIKYLPKNNIVDLACGL